MFPSYMIIVIFSSNVVVLTMLLIGQFLIHIKFGTICSLHPVDVVQEMRIVEMLLYQQMELTFQKTISILL